MKIWYYGILTVVFQHWHYILTFQETYDVAFGGLSRAEVFMNVRNSTRLHIEGPSTGTLMLEPLVFGDLEHLAPQSENHLYLHQGSQQGCVPNCKP